MNPQQSMKTINPIRCARQLLAAALGTLSCAAAFSAVNVIQNTGPGATAWPGTPVVATMANPGGTATVPENFASGGGCTGHSQTFTVPAGSNYYLQAITIYAGDGTGTSQGVPLTLNIYSLGAQVAPNPSGYAASTNLLGGGAGASVAYTVQSPGLLRFEFSGTDQLLLVGGNMYAFELTGVSGTAPVNWYRNTSDTYTGGAAYRDRSWINGSNARDFAVAVYASPTTDQPPPTQCTVNRSITHQLIDGFGAGVVFLDGGLDPLSDSEMDTLFGTANSSQFGLSLIRVRISPDGNWDNANLTDAQKAYARGAQILASPWSPPASMKDSHRTVGGSLLPAEYANYAAYLNSFASFMASNGAPLAAISIQNEPDWEPSYEGCAWTPAQLQTFMRENAGAITLAPVMMPESLNFNPDYADPTLNDVGAAANVGFVGGHLYGNAPEDYPLAHSLGIRTWMTEFLINDQGISSAIGTGLQISDCLSVGNMSAYIWWKCIGDANGLLNASGVAQPRGYVMAQFSRFVRPGDTRIDVNNNTSSLGITAFKKPSGNDIAIVVVNAGASAVTHTFNLQNVSVSAMTPWITSATQQLQTLASVAVSGNAFTYVVPAGSVVTFVSGGTPGAPSAPTGLTATAASGTQVNLSWTASSGATSYNVLRATASGGPYTAIASGVAATTYNDSGLTPSTTYYYVVQAVNSNGTSGNSSQAVVSTPASGTAPLAPSAVSATPGKKPRQITVKWTQSTSPNLSSNKVYRATVSGGPYTLVGTVQPAGTSYNDNSATSGQLYHYVVTATNSANLESTYSNEASATAR